MIMTEIEKAEEILANLQAKQRGLASKAVELADERQRISFAAHANGDAKARKRLDEITAATVARQSEMASIEAAISEAEKRLAEAQRNAAIAADRQQAEQLSKEWQCFAATARKLDEHLKQVVALTRVLEETVREMNKLGAASPSQAQVNSLGSRAITTALMSTPFARSFEHLPPRERQTFTGLAEGWSVMVRQNIAARMGADEQPNKTTEAANAA